MDELAVRLEMDPLDLRLANLAERDPVSGQPFAHHDLGRCLEVGAQRFGWRERSRSQHGRGRWARGHGMAACTRPNLLVDAEARVRLCRDGRFVVELDMTDIGTGTYTILSQIVADHFRVGLDAIEVRLGDSAHPKTSGSGGSFGAASSGSAVLDACESLARKLVERATGDPEAPLAAAVGQKPEFRDGALHMGGSAASYGDIADHSGGEIEAEGGFHPDRPKTAQYSWGAHFVELDVDRVTGEVRLRRALGTFSFGRVLNRRTARSQLLGGMTFGIGGALTESLMLDPRTGAFANRDFAGYHLPVQRDIPDLDVVMLDEPVEGASKLRAKGIGELGLSGIGGAIANAVYDAVGIRLRDFPLTPDRLLAHM